MPIVKKEKTVSFLMGLVILLSTLSFTPIIREGGLYSMISRTLFVLLALLLLMVFKPNVLWGNSWFRTILLLVLFNVVQTAIFSVGGFQVRWSDAFSLLYTFLFIYIGYCAPIRKELWNRLCFVFSISAIVLGIYVVFYFLGGMSFYYDMYAVEAKNQIGQVVAIGCFVAVTMTKLVAKKMRWIWIVFVVIGVLCLMFIRCRTAAATFLIVLALYYFRKSKVGLTWNAFVILILIIVSLPFLYDRIYAFFQDAFIGVKDINDMDSLSTNRIERNINGLIFFSNHPFLGELKDYSGVPMIHNYFINRLSAYGIFSLPYFFFYFAVLSRVIQSWRNDGTNGFGVGSLAIPFVVSMLEPGAPFGPGMLYVFAYMLFGSNLRSNATKSRG